MIGQRIKQRRIELGLSQDDLAQKLGYKDRSTLSYIEKDGENLPVPKLKEIAKALRVDPRWLMGMEPIQLTQDEQQLIDSYRELNQDGKDKLSEYARDLVASGRYIKNNQPVQKNA